MGTETFGEVLRRLRLRNDLSVRALARRANCGKTHVSDLENGRRNPSLTVATALDRALRANGELLASKRFLIRCEKDLPGVSPSPTPTRFCYPLCSFATSTTQTTPKRSSSIP